MAPSFRDIDYSIRPAKHAERKMMLEIFRRLAVFAPLSDYRYIGLGSVWFSDFQLFHRALGIPDMVSIERVQPAEMRIRANVPFAAIEPIFKTTTVALPELDWAKRQIVWLDYDDPLSPAALGDVSLVAARAVSGSLIAVSLQHHHATELDEAKEAGGEGVDLFRGRYDRGLLPPDFSEVDLYGRPFARLTRTMLHSSIENALLARNAGLDQDTQGGEVLHYRRICDIEYADGAPMTTTIGMIVSSDEAHKIEALDLPGLDFLGNAEMPVRIEVPKITPREARILEQQLPRGPGFSVGHIPESDANAFSAFYRYLPTFTAVDL